jgi:hypothetical protein
MHAPFPSRRMAGGRRGPYSMERKAAPARAEAISPARAFLSRPPAESPGRSPMGNRPLRTALAAAAERRAAAEPLLDHSLASLEHLNEIAGGNDGMPGQIAENVITWLVFRPVRVLIALKCAS